MDPLALTLVLASAGIHAGWNLLAKRVLGGFGVAWAYAAVASLATMPLGIVAARTLDEPPSLLAWGFVTGSALLHVGYFVSLQRGYRLGDLSLVYPLARGSGPALATIAAVAFLNERPGPLVVAGTALVAIAAFGLAGGTSAGSGRAVRAGLATGLFIAAYSVWDATAVARVGIAPLLYTWLSETMRAVVLAPLAVRRREEVARAWRTSRWSLIGVGVLSPLAYLLVLYAFRLAPVSQVAPTREVSILIGVALGTGLLQEGHAARRLLAAAAMAAGVAMLASGRAS